MKPSSTFFASIGLVLFMVLLPPKLFGQIDRFIKKKAEKVLVKEGKKVLVKRLSSARDEFDESNFNYAIALSDKAALFENKERFERHQNLLLNVLSSDQDKAKGNADVARDYLDAGEMFYASNRYKNAELSFLAAKVIYEDINAYRDPNYATTLSNLGLVYHTTGRYTLAEEFTFKAAENRKKNVGPSSIAYGASLNNIAVLLKDKADYNEAETKSEEALKVIGGKSGKESMPYAIALNNHAMLLQTMGREEDALRYMEECIQIAEEELGERTGNFQLLMTNLALIHQDLENYDKAEEIFLRAIQLKERRFGKNHPDYAHMLNNLASLYMEMGKYEEVEELILTSLDIYERRFGRNHPSFATASSNLGNFYLFMEDFDKAGKHLEKALEVRRLRLGENNPLFVKSLEDMAIWSWQSGQIDKAKASYDEVLDKNLSFIESYFPPMSEAEKTKYWSNLKPSFFRFYAFALDNAKDHPDLIGKMYNYHLATKGILLDEANKIRKVIMNSGDDQLIEEYLLWVDQKENLSRLYSYSQEELKEENINLDSLERASNRTERALSSKSSLFAKGLEKERPDFRKIAAVLGPNQSAVEFVHGQHFDKQLQSDAYYAALVIDASHAKGEIQPGWVLLEKGNDLDGRYFKYYKNAIRQRIKDEYSYDQYWKPLTPLLKDKKEVYLSMDGVYTQLNPNTFRQANGTFLIDRFSFSFLGSTRELLDKASRASEPSSLTADSRKHALLLGAPLYGSRNLIDPLPGTQKEIESIVPFLKKSNFETEVFFSNYATEEVLKAADNPTLLHVATHGFFLQDVPESGGKVFGVNPDRARQNPLLRSGLMFAGVEDAISGDTTRSISSNNGILTAFEASSLSLDQTKLVVLSACETGLGDIVSGEGVYGLQRAFQVAGANTIIMSLWKVDDQATQKLMTRFYEQWLLSNDKKQAFRKAQMVLKNEYKDPYYWGAFLLIGG